jgi:hypothetical protein
MVSYALDISQNKIPQSNCKTLNSEKKMFNSIEINSKVFTKKLFFKEGPLIVLKEPSNVRDLSFNSEVYHNNKLGNYGIQRSIVTLRLVRF